MSKTKPYFVCSTHFVHSTYFVASLFLAILASVFGTIYNIYTAPSVSAATASITTSGSINLDVSPSGNSASIGVDNLTVNTTCASGYNISIRSSITNATLYKDGNSTSNSRISPSTGTASNPVSILGNNLGTWGYSMTDSTVTGTFTGLTNTPTIIKTSNTASGDGSGDPTTGIDTIPVYYGVSITPTLEPGSYTMAKDPNNNNNPGVIVYELTMPIICEPYTISYNGNGADTSTTMSVKNIVDTDVNSTTTLMPSNYKRPGFGFAGWNTKADGTGTDFGPMETVTLTTTDPKGNALLQAADPNTRQITLYAKWIQSTGNLQSWQGCNSMTTGQVTALTDTRDNNTYAIAKLADNNCWMIENLRLSDTDQNGNPVTLNSTNTDNPASGFTRLPAGVTSWCTGATAECIDQPVVVDKNTKQATSDMTSADFNAYGNGNAYNWVTATAGNGVFSLPTPYSQIIQGSICPAGWHLPSGGSVNAGDSEYLKLATAMLGYGPNISYNANKYYYGNGDGSTKGSEAFNAFTRYPYNFVLGAFNNRGTYSAIAASYWTSNISTIATTGNTPTAWSTAIYSETHPDWGGEGFWPGTMHSARFNVQRVRCVANVTLEQAYEKAGKTKQNGYYKMQDMNSDICSVANVYSYAGQATLIDTRDNKLYTATKLKDGKCWMTSNLRLGNEAGGSSITLTSATSDISSNFNLPGSITTVWGIGQTDEASANSAKMNSNGNQWLSGDISSSFDMVVETTGTPDTPSRYIGNYYNWYTATAGTGTYAMTSGEATGSICPKGWRLPTGGATGEFQALYVAYNSDVDAFMAAASFVPSGGRSAGATSNRAQGSDGNWWSSTADATNYLAKSLQMGRTFGGVYPNTTNSKTTGRSVRCVAK